MSLAATDLAPALEAAIEAHGLAPCRATPISSLHDPDRTGRIAYRVETEDGRRVKLRLLESEDAVRRLVVLRSGIDPAFTAVVARYGPVLLEEWVEGEPLPGSEAEARVEEAAALLGRLHRTPLADEPDRCSSEPWREAAESDLLLLAEAGRLPEEPAEALRRRLAAEDPGEARAALIHRDFCAENLIVDPGGQLHMVDNEWLMVGPPAWDLGRTFHRWPMSPDAWERFTKAHRAEVGEPEAYGFWQLSATLLSARVFHQHAPERLPPLLAILEDLARA